MAILNTKPIITNSFGIWWLKDITVTKINDTRTRLMVQFVPFDGVYILGVQPKVLHLDVETAKENDETFNTVIDALYSELKRQYEFKNSKFKTFGIKYINIRAQDPARPVMVVSQLLIDEKIESFIINDVFSLARTDAAFGDMVSTFIDEFGRQAKLKKIID